MMKKLRRWIPVVLFVFLAVLAVSAFAETAAPKQYTVMYYMCGSDLERDHGQMTAELAAILSSRFNTEAVNSIGLLGGTPRWAASQFDPEVLSVVNISGRRPKAVDTMPLAPMDDPATLTAFLDYCLDNYPADHYILVISDHGGGPLLGCCKDLISKGIMNSLSLKQAFENSRLAQSGLDIITFDCCLMGSAEIANIVYPYAKYMVATEDSMFGIGYEWLAGLENDGSVLDTAVRIADSTYKKNRDTIRRQHAAEKNSVSVIDLEKMPAVVQAMNDYFTGETAVVDTERFSALSNHRRDSVSFGITESGGFSGYDLVDAGSLIGELEKQGGSSGETLMSAFRDAVAYHAADVDGCLGLTLYHPYSNKKQAADSMEVYAGLGFSPSYVDYVIRYTAIMTDQPLARWENLLTVVPEASKDLRTLFCLDLDEEKEQFTHFAGASLKVFQQLDDGSYRFTFVTDRVDLKEDTKRITGEYTYSALYAVDAGGNPLSSPLPYYLSPDGTVLIPASLTLPYEDGSGSVVHKALICCAAENDVLEPGCVMVWDEVLQAWTGSFRTVFGDYSDISVSLQSRREVRDELGTLLPFDQWETVQDETWTRAIDGGWSFRFLKETLEPTALYASFEIQDSQSNRYASDLRAVKRVIGPDPEPFNITYDDGGLVLIKDFYVKTLGDQLLITAEVTNIAEAETVIAFADFAVNGNALEIPGVEVLGSGEYWGLVKDERQPLSVSVPLELLAGTESVTEISFTMNCEDAASGELFGSVPAVADGRLNLK